MHLFSPASLPLLLAVPRVPTVVMQRSDAERRDQLRQLFGKKAADDLVPLTSRERAEADAQEVQMLQDGPQELEWGAVRLVDVDMADGPLELALQPLLAGPSQLLCLRLDMPLGMALEESGDGGDGGDEDASQARQIVVTELLDSGSARGGGVEAAACPRTVHVLYRRTSCDTAPPSPAVRRSTVAPRTLGNSNWVGRPSMAVMAAGECEADRTIRAFGSTVRASRQ